MFTKPGQHLLSHGIVIHVEIYPSIFCVFHDMVRLCSPLSLLPPLLSFLSVLYVEPGPSYNSTPSPYANMHMNLRLVLLASELVLYLDIDLLLFALGFSYLFALVLQLFCIGSHWSCRIWFGEFGIGVSSVGIAANP